MIARSPGKLVLSGAYSVLEGAPALVAAVDRYVVADGDREPTFLAHEVGYAVEAGALDRACWFDAGELREPQPDGSSRKLGLGSSAAILVATLAARLGHRLGDEEVMRKALFPIARSLHWRAQRGGSGVDVASSTFGGVLAATLDLEGASPGKPPELSVAPHPLPRGTVVEVFASPVSASTPELLAKVRDLAERLPGEHRTHLDAAGAGARAALAATTVAELVAAVSAQTTALDALGEAARAGIVTPEVRELRALAEAEGSTFAPSGAGGGDIAFFLGGAPSSPALRARAEQLGLALLSLTVGARGAHLVDP